MGIANGTGDRLDDAVVLLSLKPIPKPFRHSIMRQQGHRAASHDDRVAQSANVRVVHAKVGTAEVRAILASQARLLEGIPNALGDGGIREVDASVA